MKRCKSMDTMTAIKIVAGCCGFILLILLLKKNAQILLNFFVRFVLGVMGILLLNQFFLERGLSIYVGLNPVSLLTVGILGLPGVALLYGIVATKFL